MMKHVPRNPAFEAAVRSSFARQGMMRLLAAQLLEISPGYCVIAAPLRDETSQQHGFGHAGLGWSIGDSAAGFAALSLLEPDNEIVSVEMKINLLAPARGERLIAEGRIIRAGRRLLTVASEIYAEQQSVRTHIATMIGTMYVVPSGQD